MQSVSQNRQREPAQASGDPAALRPSHAAQHAAHLPLVHNALQQECSLASESPEIADRSLGHTPEQMNQNPQVTPISVLINTKLVF